MCNGATIAAPNVPAPDPNQLALEQAQLKSLNDQSSLYEGILPIMTKQMGLTYDPSTGKYSMSPEAEQQLTDQQTLANAQTKLGLAGLPLAQQQMEMEKTAMANEASLQPVQQQIAQQQAQRQLLALQGKLPLPSGMSDQKDTEFQQLIRQQAQMGNTITGEAPESAASNSTSGQQALKAFATRWQNTQDAYQLNELNAGTSLYQSGTGMSAGLASTGYAPSQGYSNPTGYVSNNPTFTGALPNINYLGLASGYGSAQQPYQFQQGMNFQSNQQGSQNFAGLLSGLAGGAAQGATYAMMA